MNKINLLGIHIFLLIYLKYYSYYALFIYCNGVLYHSLSDSSIGFYLRKYDLICNICIISYCHYLGYEFLNNTDRCLTCLMLLFNSLNKYKFNCNQYFHVFFIQFNGAYIMNKFCYQSIKL